MIKKIIFLLLILTNIGCDQISKNKVRDNVGFGERIELIDNKFVLTKVENTGAALGLGTSLPSIGKQILLNFLPLVVVLGLLLHTLARNHIKKWMCVAFAFIIGGGLGNLMDRFLFGSVTDFLYIQLGIFKTGIFNMADVSITIGAIIALIFSFQRKPEATN